MLKHGDILQIKLTPFYKDEIYFGKVIDYSYLFDAYKYNLFIHVFENLADVNKGIDFLFTNPIQIRVDNIFLDFEKRITIIGHEEVKNNEFLEKFYFRVGQFSNIERWDSFFSIMDLKLGFSTLEYEINISECINLELIQYHTLYTIIDRIIIEKLILENSDVSIFENVRPKNIYKELVVLYNLYKGKTPYKKQKKDQRNYFEIDWSILLNSKYKSHSFEKRTNDQKPKFQIFFDFQFEFSIYDPLFQKYGFRAISYTWAGIILLALDTYANELEGFDINTFKIDVIDNTRFTYNFKNKGERDSFFEIIETEVAKPTRIEKWLKMLQRNKAVQEFIFYKHPSLEVGYEEKSDEVISVEKLSSENIYLSFFKYVSKKSEHQMVEEYGIKISMDEFSEFTDKYELDIYFESEDFDKAIRPEIKKVLELKKTTFIVDDCSDSITYVFKNIEQFKLVKSYLLKLFSSDRKVKKWLEDNFI